jgi:rRNA maturation RNase YbeY
MNGSASLAKPRKSRKRDPAASVGGFFLRNLGRSEIPRFPFEALKDHILGKHFTLSLAFVGERRARSLNLRYRGKTYIPNVLSFPLSRTEGEIVICMTQARREYRAFETSFTEFVLQLYIHGCLHLKGLSHGSRMSKQEQAIQRKFAPARGASKR